MAEEGLLQWLRRKFTRSGAPPAPRSPVVDHHRSPDRYRSPVGYPPVGYLDPPPVGYLDPPPAALGSHPHLDLYRSLDLGYRSPVAHVQEYEEYVPTPPPRGRNVGSFSTRKSLQISEESNDDPDTIRLENHGIEVRIPRNEAYSAKDFIVNAITDVPPELLIKENEAIITVGLEIRLPSDAVFGHPVEITMPHCGRFTKPEKVEIVSYYRQSASKQFVAISSSIGVSPRCVVRHSDLDISFNHFSEYWIVAILEEVFVGKRVICTPYVPVRPLKNSMSVLFLQVRDANEHEEEDARGYIAPLKGEQFFFKWSSGSLKICCPESTKGETPMTIEKSDVRHLTDHRVMFKVDTSNARDDQMIVTFILEQSTTKEILITMNLTDVPSVQSALSYEKSTSEPVMAPSTSTSVPPQDDCLVHGCQKRKITDDLLNRLARDIPNGNYYDLCGKLEYGYDQAKNTLDKNKNDCAKATRECLAGWTNKATRSLADLHRVLILAGLGGKINHTLKV